MLFNGMGAERTAISDDVHMEVVTGLYGTTTPPILSAICQSMVGAITIFVIGDMATAVLTVAGVAVAMIRLAGVFAFRRRLARAPQPGRAEMESWERRYFAGSVTTAFIFGAFAGRVLVLDDAVCSVMAIGVGFGFGAGTISRLSLRPVAASLHLVAIGVPAVVATLMQGDLNHVGVGLLIALYVLASFEMVRMSFNAAIGQIRLKQQFEQLARLDPMTGLFNRSVLAVDLPKMLSDCAAGTVAVHALDLDRFKEANDRFGHPAGDALLREVAGRLRTIAAQDDLVIRMGGDEFVLVQREPEGAAGAEAMAQHIVRSISAPYDLDGQEIELGVSVGVAIAPGDGGDVEALLSRSDKALYRAKGNRGGYVLAGELHLPAAVVLPDQRMAERRSREPQLPVRLRERV
ncbi:GGDEF domain-containing protein [Bradyrhizobium diazoefficiens]|nr:GGDEF domain-containing protein [Bradyrhizobium diazoefficiens]MBR0849238.1 GGDEF domain-containing protein [Bradyrhizobium diazoefficiens]